MGYLLGNVEESLALNQDLPPLWIIPAAPIVFSCMGTSSPKQVTTDLFNYILPHIFQKHSFGRQLSPRMCSLMTIHADVSG